MEMTLKFNSDTCFPKPNQCFPSTEFYHQIDSVSEKMTLVFSCHPSEGEKFEQITMTNAGNKGEVRETNTELTQKEATKSVRTI